jgi:hexosaminidase
MKHTMFAILILTAVFSKRIFFQAAYGVSPDGHDFAIIPKPTALEPLEGMFSLTSASVIRISHTEDNGSLEVAQYLNNQLYRSTGLRLQITHHGDNQPAPANSIMFTHRIARTELGKEGYELEVGPEQVTIRAGHKSGFFYGVQTLLQLLPPEIYSQYNVDGVEWTIPAVRIADSPRYRWRGMHLDVCRHFMPGEFVRKYIDILAMHKMNVFHWHLTEDQGWRVEIKRYPRLTETGAWRPETHSREDVSDHMPHGGFYTQEEIRDIVKYAQERCITVIPEIEMPGHAQAALSAYPQYACASVTRPIKIRTHWGISKIVYCPGKDETFDFLENILSEVIELFPGELIHIGGDEAPKTTWERCGDCQSRIKAEGLRDEHELQSYFVRRIERFLNAHGRRLIGWDEILQG